jgi:hypothetical protein
MGADGGEGTGAPSGGGRSGSGGGGGGGGSNNVPFARTATVQPRTLQQFQESVLTNTPNRRILVGAINGAGGGGSSLSSIYASVSHATGIPQGRGLAEAVNKHISDLDRSGKISVTLESTTMRHGKDAGARAGKMRWTRDPDGELVPATINTYRISISDPKMKKEGVAINSPHTLGIRPDRFDPAKGGLADKALKYRKETYADTRLAPQGRYHSSLTTAPEMMYGDERKDLAAKGKISPKDAKGLDGTPINGKYVRNEVFHAKQIHFFDATSSVTAHIGVMTDDENSLRMSKLVKGKGKPAHHDLAVNVLGVDKSASAKPYFTVLSGSKGSMTASDFEGLRKGEIKDIVKSIWTPGSYGSKAIMGGYDSMGVKVAKKLEAGGMKPELAKSTAKKMLDNFNETSLAQFSPGFRGLIKEAPSNFVYENPMSGYRMSFNKHDTESITLRLGGGKQQGSLSTIDKPVQIKATITGKVNKTKTGNGASALFVQNWDSAVMSDLMLENKSPHTVHDAIGIKFTKAEIAARKKNPLNPTSLHSSVVKSMQKAQKIRPLEDLASQILRQHERNGTTPAELKLVKKRLEANLKKMRKSNTPIKLYTPTDYRDQHFVEE